MRLPLSEPGFATPSDLAACRASLRDGSKSFLAAGRLLPLAVRGPACSLYAFCRLADDAVDLGTDRALAVEQLRARLDRVYAGRPLPEPADRAFADVVARFDLPRAWPEALIEGFLWDAEGRHYQTLSELYGYAARVAGTVGVMMARLMGVTDAQALARACDLGVAMQLTNIIRDVGEDARAGRLYLPLDWLDAAGIEPEAWRAAPAFTPALGSVLQRLQRVAAELYERSECGIVALPPACRPGIFAARYLYAGIGDEVARRGWNSVDGRAVLSASWKIRLLMQALYSAAQKRKTVVAPPLEETRFLVEAAADADALTRGKRAPAPRLVWLIDLFERLERREQAARIGSSF